MKRRELLQLPLAALPVASVALVPAAAQAQGGFVEGTHFVRLGSPAQVSLPPGKKIEVVEFFWYGCPHCNSFEPLLEDWLKRLPADVAFRQVHVGFTPMHQLHQRLFFALEELGQLGALHRRVFAAMHIQNKRLLSESEIVDWAAAQGLDAAKFRAAYTGFNVDAKARQARRITDAYKIDAVPALGVNGRFFTQGGLAGGLARMTQVADFLIQRSRTQA
jgi:thiol:disulfide interchange protein DsbA